MSDFEKSDCLQWACLCIIRIDENEGEKNGIESIAGF